MPQPESPPPVVLTRDGITLAEFDQLRTRLRRQRERLHATLAKLDRLTADISLPKQRHQPAINPSRQPDGQAGQQEC